MKFLINCRIHDCSVTRKSNRIQLTRNVSKQFHLSCYGLSHSVINLSLGQLIKEKDLRLIFNQQSLSILENANMTLSTKMRLLRCYVSLRCTIQVYNRGFGVRPVPKNSMLSSSSYIADRLLTMLPINPFHIL